MRSIHLARIGGIDLGLHWSWFLVALVEIQMRRGAYASVGWNVLEYLALFAIVTLHEFGHALACRSVGGTAEKIVLWPLGGVAYVNPPQRPGAMLWSLAAGPLVNVALAPLLYVTARWGAAAAVAMGRPDLAVFTAAVEYVNLGLLIFNLVPVYPLDGGQILRSLLWYPLGRARSLMAAAGIGLVGVVGLGILALRMQDLLLGAICVFIVWNCWGGLQQARALWRLSKLPRRSGFACPSCRSQPPVGRIWRCAGCAIPFDAFACDGQCPRCGTALAQAACIDCGQLPPLRAWSPAIVVLPAR